MDRRRYSELTVTSARYSQEWLGIRAVHIIIDIVLILAILELIRILQSYLALGRVKVTFILDVAMVVLIGELIGLWYRGIHFAGSWLTHYGNCRTDITAYCFHSFFTQCNRLIQPKIYFRLNHIRSSESNSPVLAD
ncbi:MAG: hypothetical protein Q7T85_10500 [Nitrosomonas sp.]|nr:hypothetical protein [Nitrosomonas sp.]